MVEKREHRCDQYIPQGRGFEWHRRVTSPQIAALDSIFLGKVHVRKAFPFADSSESRDNLDILLARVA